VTLENRVVQYALSGGDHLAYMTAGDGPVDLVWCSPGISNVESWDMPLLKEHGERLAAFSRLISFDSRGAGLSDPVPVDALPTLEERADELRAVLDAAGSERAAIVGQGHGGAACLLFAGTHPERVSSLILYDTYARWMRDDDYAAGMPAAATEQYREFVRNVWGTGGSIEGFIPSLANDQEARQRWAKLERMGASMAAIDALMAMWTQTDVRDILPSIRVPTLVMQRTDDVQFRLGHGRYLAEQIPGAKYVELPGGDHFWAKDGHDPVVGEIEEFVTGRRSALSADRVLATVMFTDIVGSTAKASEMGDNEWRRVLDRHDELVKRELDRYRGRAVTQTGDGVMATFDGPGRAISCACAIRDGVRALGLEVRAGLHTGEIERRGDNISGIGVHIAARVAASAECGEVLVSSTVKDLVVGSGITFEDRGRHALKGVADEWQLLGVAALHGS
jgi:pimeloyl-ACP methyl ester carboxylesterase/class 3 adenylate cyclase